MKAGTKTGVLATRVPQLTFEQVEQAAASRGVTVAEMLRWLIDEWMADEERFDKVRELAYRRKLCELLEQASAPIMGGDFGQAVALVEDALSKLKAIEAGDDIASVFPAPVEAKPPDLVTVPASHFYPDARPGVGVRVLRADAIAAGLLPDDESEGKSTSGRRRGKKR
jgi:hypothetical protein